MAISLSEDRGWAPANWVLRNFFEQAQPYLHLVPHLADDIMEAITTQVPMVSLRSAGTEAVRELLVLTNKVIEFNRERGSAGWHSPEFFPGYMDQLEKLRALAAEAISESMPPPPTQSSPG
jgi:hypothetical protein